MEGFAPDFVLVSSGFDALAGDPLGGQLLEPEDFHEHGAGGHGGGGARCGGRVVALLEGGYEPARLGVATVAVIRALAGSGGVGKRTFPTSPVGNLRWPAGVIFPAGKRCIEPDAAGPESRHLRTHET